MCNIMSNDDDTKDDTKDDTQILTVEEYEKILRAWATMQKTCVDTTTLMHRVEMARNQANRLSKAYLTFIKQNKKHDDESKIKNMTLTIIRDLGTARPELNHFHKSITKALENHKDNLSGLHYYLQYCYVGCGTEDGRVNPLLDFLK